MSWIKVLYLQNLFYRSQVASPPSPVQAQTLQSGAKQEGKQLPETKNIPNRMAKDRPVGTQERKTAIISLNLEQINDESETQQSDQATSVPSKNKSGVPPKPKMIVPSKPFTQKHKINKSQKIDFPGQEPNILQIIADKSQAVESDEEVVVINEDDEQGQAQPKNKREVKRSQKKQVLNQVSSSSEAQTDINQRRSSRNALNEKPNYALDNMKQNIYHEALFQKEIIKKEQQMLEYAIQMSLQEKIHNKQRLKSRSMASQSYIEVQKMNRKQQQKLEVMKKSVSELLPPVPTQTVTREPKKGLLKKRRVTQQYDALDFYEIGSSSSPALSDQDISSESEFRSAAQSVRTETESNSSSPVQKQSQAQIELNDLLETKKEQVSPKKTVASSEKVFQAPLPPKKLKEAFQSKREGTQDKYVAPDSVTNPMDVSIRDDFTPVVKFVDFNNQNTENALYKPALMQKTQAQAAQTEVAEEAPSIASTAESSQIHSQFSMTDNLNHKDLSKTHFIKKKQSHCNVKRMCGVSYVRKTESKQENVRSRYQKLPPIVIQGSYTLNQNEFTYEVAHQVQNVLDLLFFDKDDKSTMLVITTFESFNEVEMKNYLLKPNKRLQIANGKYWIIRKDGTSKSILDHLWRFVRDKWFLCIHLVYDQDQLVKSLQIPDDCKDLNAHVADFVVKSDICIGLLPKRGNASVKSMLKAYKLEHCYENHIKQSFKLSDEIKCKGATISGINTIAFLSRLELYVNEHQWRRELDQFKSCTPAASMRIRQALTMFINLLEDHISNVLMEWNEKRTSPYQFSIIDSEKPYITSIQIGQTLIKETLQKKIKPKDIKAWQDLAPTFKSVKKPIGPEIKKILVGECNDSMKLSHLSVPIPITLINTRDCFAFDLKYIEEKLDCGPGRSNVIKKQYHFDPMTGGYPNNFKQVLGLKAGTDMKDRENLKIGVTCYENFFSPQELDDLEAQICRTEKKSLDDGFLPMTAQKTFTGTNLKRTKFFFGFRYMWTRTQLQDPLANVAAGVRADVSAPPMWMRDNLEKPLVDAGVVDKDFINSIALNVYHDGSEGLAQHFDDATRFRQPIFTLRLFSDSRLSFGSQYYGFQNGMYTIPLPRGCILVMEENSYSANGVKHCIRPCDMTGKSAAVILRQMHPNVIEEATKLDRNIDLPMWLSCLSLDEKATPFYKQKDIECQWLEKNIGGCTGTQTKTKTSVFDSKQVRGGKQSKDNKNAVNKFEDDGYQIRKLVDDIITRIEVKHEEETIINSKIDTLRQQLQSDDKFPVLKLFEINRK